jgi:hypothetical protein
MRATKLIETSISFEPEFSTAPGKRLPPFAARPIPLLIMNLNEQNEPEDFDQRHMRSLDKILKTRRACASCLSLISTGTVVTPRKIAPVGHRDYRY